MIPTRLYIPPHTRLETVWRTVDDTGVITWHVYTACADRNAPWNKMRGTALQLNYNGSVERYTEEVDYIKSMEVMPRVKEN